LCRYSLVMQSQDLLPEEERELLLNCLSFKIRQILAVTVWVRKLHLRLIAQACQGQNLEYHSLEAAHFFTNNKWQWLAGGRAKVCRKTPVQGLMKVHAQIFREAFDNAAITLSTGSSRWKLEITMKIKNPRHVPSPTSCVSGLISILNRLREAEGLPYNFL
jgi:hypothetical protein